VFPSDQTFLNGLVVYKEAQFDSNDGYILNMKRSTEEGRKRCVFT